MTDLDRLLELARKATPGPWASFRGKPASGGYVMRAMKMKDGKVEYPQLVAEAMQERDSFFVAMCGPDTIIALIERVKEAEKSAEVDGEVAKTLILRDENLEARLRAAEEVVEAAKEALSSVEALANWASGEGVMDSPAYTASKRLRDALRALDEGEA